MVLCLSTIVLNTVSMRNAPAIAMNGGGITFLGKRSSKRASSVEGMDAYVSPHPVTLLSTGIKDCHCPTFNIQCEWLTLLYVKLLTFYTLPFLPQVMEVSHELFFFLIGTCYLVGKRGGHGAFTAERVLLVRKFSLLN